VAEFAVGEQAVIEVIPPLRGGGETTKVKIVSRECSKTEVDVDVDGNDSKAQIIFKIHEATGSAHTFAFTHFPGFIAF